MAELSIILSGGYPTTIVVRESYDEMRKLLLESKSDHVEVTASENGSKKMYLKSIITTVYPESTQYVSAGEQDIIDEKAKKEAANVGSTL